MATKLKRPHDTFQLAKLIGNISTVKVVDEDPGTSKSEDAVKRGHLGGIKGAEARANNLPLKSGQR